MKVKEVNLWISAVSPKQYPTSKVPEIGLVGRSNVGKSSLTNVLINRNNYAHTSNQPGKTQTLNFYDLDHKLFLVDVPGYGYARVSKADREKWGEMIDEYLTKRGPLKGVIHLMDGRHAPTADDKQMVEWLAYHQIPIVIVLTKMDKLPTSKWQKQKALFAKELNLPANTPIILFSAKNKAGKEKVWDWISHTSKVS